MTTLVKVARMPPDQQDRIAALPVERTAGFESLDPLG
jgi:hypothetical protein